jgi:hypothetical protein
MEEGPAAAKLGRLYIDMKGDLGPRTKRILSDQSQ